MNSVPLPVPADQHACVRDSPCIKFRRRARRRHFPAARTGTFPGAGVQLNQSVYWKMGDACRSRPCAAEAVLPGCWCKPGDVPADQLPDPCTKHAARETSGIEEWGPVSCMPSLGKTRRAQLLGGVKPTELHKGYLPSSAGERPRASAWSSFEPGNCTTISENPSTGFSCSSEK